LNDGHEHQVELDVTNNFAWELNIRLMEELPFQLQERQFTIDLRLSPEEHKKVTYPLRPVVRGKYHFGQTHLFIQSIAGLVERKMTFDNEQEVAVYPSIHEMKEFELFALQRLSYMSGVKKLRRIGHSYEFEQIKNYVEGDDYRSINWKASSRKGELMVNQYEDERSQQVYTLLDKGRAMRMPFNGMSLMDYAINTSLVISNVALQKYDRAGLITFDRQIEQIVKADSRQIQLRKILQSLYNQEESEFEPNFEMLYQTVKRIVNGRSLLILFTNFERKCAMERVMPLLRRLNHFHLLLVIIFENTELEEYSAQEADNVQQIYFKTIAQKFINEKYEMVQTLQQYGIQAVLSKPEELSLNTVNKYLELKAKGLI
jgi:uncharacterized protein (DUF58 family)